MRADRYSLQFVRDLIWSVHQRLPMSEFPGKLAGQIFLLASLVKDSILREEFAQRLAQSGWTPDMIFTAIDVGDSEVSTMTDVIQSGEMNTQFLRLIAEVTTGLADLDSLEPLIPWSQTDTVIADPRWVQQFGYGSTVERLEQYRDEIRKCKTSSPEEFLRAQMNLAAICNEEGPRAVEELLVDLSDPDSLNLWGIAFSMEDSEDFIGIYFIKSALDHRDGKISEITFRKKVALYATLIFFLKGKPPFGARYFYELLVSGIGKI